MIMNCFLARKIQRFGVGSPTFDFAERAIVLLVDLSTVAFSS